MQLKKKKAKEIVIEHSGCTFTFRTPDGCDQIGFWTQDGIEGQFRKVFTLLTKVDGLIDEDGKPAGKERVLDLDGTDLATISHKFFDALTKLREAEEKNVVTESNAAIG